MLVPIGNAAFDLSELKKYQGCYNYTNMYGMNSSFVVCMLNNGLKFKINASSKENINQIINSINLIKELSEKELTDLIKKRITIEPIIVDNCDIRDFILCLEKYTYTRMHGIQSTFVDCYTKGGFLKRIPTNSRQDSYKLIRSAAILSTYSDEEYRNECEKQLSLKKVVNL